MRVSAVLLVVGALACGGAPAVPAVPVAPAAPEAPDRAEKPAEPAMPAAAPIELLHLGNEGFLVSAPDGKVLIDALQGDGLKGYVTLPPDRREELEVAKAPFDDVDLILVTHHHEDHFNARSVARYLGHNPGARLVSTSTVADRLRRELGDESSVLERVSGFDVVEGEPVELEYQGIELEVLSLHHGRGRGVDNLGFIFELGGKRILHVGDTWAIPSDFWLYELAEREIDIALLPVWLLLRDDWVEYERAIGAETIVGMHVPEPGAAPRYFGTVKTHTEFLELLSRVRPEAILFWEPGQRRTFGP